MKYTFDYNGVKRQIDGAFGICGSRNDLKHLADEIYKELGDGNAMTYGWISIRPYRLITPNTSPRKWENDEPA